VLPEVHPVRQTGLVLVGPVRYSNNPDYLPRTIRNSETAHGGIGFKYDYSIGYGKDALPEVLPLLNPLTWLGFPVGSDSLVVVGNLEILDNGAVLKTYSAVCVIEKTRSLFYQGKTSSELRRKGLLAVRDNIENQMMNDREELDVLLK
jgi:hypothetical protein